MNRNNTRIAYTYNEVHFRYISQSDEIYICATHMRYKTRENCRKGSIFSLIKKNPDLTSVVQCTIAIAN